MSELYNYRLPPTLLPSFTWSVLALRPRSLLRDGRATLAGAPPPEVVGAENIPSTGPLLITCNHYTRPGFSAWLLVLTIGVVVAAHRAPGADPEIHWVMTTAWTFPGHPWRRRLFTPLTRWFFARVAHIYGLVSMPPMPPAPGEERQRARAVRQTVRLAGRLARSGGMIGLSPEGMDHPGGFGPFPPGAGDFIALLSLAGMPVLPVGVSEPEGGLRISFGPPFKPAIPRDPEGRDEAVAGEVREAVGRQVGHET